MVNLVTIVAWCSGAILNAASPQDAKPAVEAGAVGTATESPPTAPDAGTPISVEAWSNEQLITHLVGETSETPIDTEADRVVRKRGWDEWAARVKAGKVTHDDIGAVLRSCAMIRSSPVCFEGEPYHVWMRVPWWLPGQVATATTAAAPGVSLRAKFVPMWGACGNALAGQESEESFQLVGVLPKGTTSVMFDLTIRPSEFYDNAKLNWTGTIEVPVRIIPRTEAKPVDNPELTRLVRAWSSLSCTNGFFNDGPAVWFGDGMHRPAGGPLASALVRRKVELLKDGAIVATQFIDDPDESYGMEHLASELTFIRGELARDIVLRKEIERYTVRVSGVAPQKPSQWYRVEYWSGEYTVPLADVLEAECGLRARTRLDEEFERFRATAEDLVARP